MEQCYRYAYEVKFKNGSYEFITGNSEFYKFLKDDFFITFDSLLTKNSKDVLEKAIKQCSYNTPFVLEFLFSHADEARCMVAVLTDDCTSQFTVLHMIPLDKMYLYYNNLITDNLENAAILSQLESIFTPMTLLPPILPFITTMTEKILSAAAISYSGKKSLWNLFPHWRTKALQPSSPT